ncbi:MAG: membrane protein insertion efficiency factor YidD [Clostridiales bacterium]|jgi:putative membrane protein insertion efficiency factor|nr:membrane protein insertion efficiency factor YidD [Clostridiales bacterium]
MKKILLASLKFYKRYISPFMGQNCRFFPSCSEYMYEAVQRYGAARGFWLGIKRLLRCQPFSKGGYDPVP